MKIFLIFILYFYCLNADSIEDFKMSMLKSNDTYLYEKAIEINKIKENLQNTKKETIYCLISESVSLIYLKKIILEATDLQKKTGAKVSFVLQGIYSEKFLRNMGNIAQEIEEMDGYDGYKNNMSILISPSMFTKFNIKKVPVLMYAENTEGLKWSLDNISYIARGEISLNDFFTLISKKDKHYESFLNSNTFTY